MSYSWVHYGMHFLAPLGIAYLYNPKSWKKNYLILLATMIIDLDHLWANPIFDPNRCSINFHTFHTYYAAVIYGFLLIPKKTRIVAIGLLFHLLTDFLDCFF